METFEQIWETSRTNSLSWMYPTALWVGVGVLITLGFIKRPWLRRTGKLIAIAGFVFFATEFSAQEIQEKWRLRREWADRNPTQMTEDGLSALVADGANLTLGPLKNGFQAFLLFAAVTIALAILRALIVSRRNGTVSGNGDQASGPPEFSENPYHPPNVSA